MEEERPDIGASFTESMVLEAVRRSGFPLQAKAVETALSAMTSDVPFATRTFEEWSFLDGDTDTVRQLDALVQHSITDINDLDGHDPGIPTDPRVLLRYEIDMLMECKQSELPFVFFTRPSLWTPTLPLLVGLPHEDLGLSRRGEAPLISMPLRDAVLDNHLPSLDPECAISVSRCRRKGKDLELSGEDVFRSLTVPVRKALAHYVETSEREKKRRLYHDVRFVYPVVVLDAPMLGCNVEGNTVTLKTIQVARLSLSEPSSSGRSLEGYNRWDSLDFVHIDHLHDYCTAALERATALAKRLDAAALQVVTGRAYFDFDSADEPDEAASPASDEQYPLATLMPTMNPRAASVWIADRFRAVHSPDPAGT